MDPSTDPAATLTALVAWQNRWLTERIDFLRADFQHSLDTREPVAEEDYRRWLHELAVTQLLLLPLLATPPTPEELLRLLQTTRQQWETQFPEDIRAVVRHFGDD